MGSQELFKTSANCGNFWFLCQDKEKHNCIVFIVKTCLLKAELRLRPGLFHSSSKLDVKPPFKYEEKTKSSSSSKEIEKVRCKVENEEEEKTSRLLMKSECRSAGGRRKNGSSLVHSIPKFSEVKKGKLSEVQKVLQSRLLSKQRLKQQQQLLRQQQQFQQQQREEEEEQFEQEPPSISNLSQKNSSLDASNLLQNMMYKHKSGYSNKTFSPLAKVRRGRKPDKREITHVLKVNAPPLSYPILPHLSEVTITPKVIYNPNPRHIHYNHNVEEALDLRTPGRCSPPPESYTIAFFSDFNSEATIQKFNFTPGDYLCLEEQEAPIQYILDPEKRRQELLLDNGVSLPSRFHSKIRPASFHSTHERK
ncbi:unnamed protein product [Lepeophtheirus salmonis]|uniref:(salmon louse) hypothetical protein n=1 Tax=Lepeophtheirus salmonis TaxID=72036 RepID=A0A7R8CW38_LEPSM|nr:unnamed protein product [Lepeophtheirus salmonis]CAF2948879.1 unnamed protein product [Lepeophtheirus salmonis]